MSVAQQTLPLSEQVAGERSTTDLFLQEINHRMANTLQMASGILLLRARSTGSSEAQWELNDVAMRINALAVLHRRLCRTDYMEAVNLSGYLQELCSEIGASTAGSNGAKFIFMAHGAQPIYVNSDTATLFGLIVTEMMTNSVKHGGEKPICRAELFIEPARLRLVVSDNGPGLSSHDSMSSSGVGLQLVQSLVSQLKAKMEFVPSPTGACFVITVPMAVGITL